MSLFKRGYDDLDRIEKEIQERRNTNTVYRFWLPPSKTTRIVFLDDNPPIYEEHQLKIKGDWRNWFTCGTPLGMPCECCERGDRPYTAGAYTIIDGTEWTDKKGNVHKNERKLFVAKFETLKKLKQISVKRGGLRGCVFEVTRTSDTSPSTGDMFDFEKKLTEEELQKLFKENAEPYNYDEILAPKSPSDLGKELDKEAANEYEEEEDINF